MAEEEEECVLPQYIEEEHTWEEEEAGRLKRQQESALEDDWKKVLIADDPETEEERAIESAKMEEISAFDPHPDVKRRVVFRYCSCDFSRFDIDEESPVQPMRYSSYIGAELMSSVNVFSAMVLAADDVGYPVNVYGTVLVRDELDHKCIYLFRRHRDNPQLVNSKDETLTLTGPSRGLLMFGYLYFEIDLKIRDNKEANDRDFRKGFLKEYAAFSAGKIIRNKFVSKLGTVELTYAHVERALEATILLKIIKGPARSKSVQSSAEEEDLSPNFKKRVAYFYGKITACATGIPIDIELYDSKVSGSVIKVDDDGYIKLSRCVIAVPVDQVLLIKIAAADGDDGVDPSMRTIDFNPEICECPGFNIYCGSYIFEVGVGWSPLYASQVDILSD